LGRALQYTGPPGTQIAAMPSAALDIGDADAVMRAVAQCQPDVIVNAAAYTAVDRAESDAAAAQRVNMAAVGHLRAAAEQAGARLVHVSTDFVFDGRQSTPYRPDDAPSPLGVYARTKHAGEGAAGPDALIVRTSWVYAAGRANFVTTMLRLMATRDDVRVVADQIGSPTWADALAATLWTLTAQAHTGIWHYRDSGVASWYDFAVAIQDEALSLGLLTRKVPVIPITTADYPTPAQRPPYSVLDTSVTTRATGAAAAHWRDNLKLMLKAQLIHG
jgi:dTDP-4-dehydrorhamnose reductase